MATLKNLQKTAGKLSSIANTRLPDVQGVVAASADGNIRLVNKTQLPNTIRAVSYTHLTLPTKA